MYFNEHFEPLVHQMFEVPRYFLVIEVQEQMMPARTCVR